MEKSWCWEAGHGWQQRGSANIPKAAGYDCQHRGTSNYLCYTCYMLAYCREVVSIQCIMPPALGVCYLSMPGINFGNLAGGRGSGEPKGGCAGWQLLQEGAELWSTLVIGWVEWSNLSYAASSHANVCPKYRQSGKWLLYKKQGCQASVTNAETCD